MENKDSNTVTLSKDTLYGGVIVALVILLVLSIFTQGFGIMKPSTTYVVGNTTNTSGTAVLDPLPQLSVGKGSLPLLGKDSAPVAIVEFSDFQCPFCERLNSDAIAQIKTNYVNSGKVKLYFRDLPLSFHQNAMPAAMAARCANEQGKFWQMHDKLFATQGEWSSASDANSKFEGYAEGLGINKATFSTCLSTSKYSGAISTDSNEAGSLGVRGTPGSFIIMPKTKMDGTAIRQVANSLKTQNAEVTLFENSNEYLVLIPGAYPYQVFDAFLSKVKY